MSCLNKREEVKVFYGDSLPWAIDEEDRIYAFPEYFFATHEFMQNIRRTTQQIVEFFQKIKQYFLTEKSEESIKVLMDCLFIDDRLKEFVQIDVDPFFSPIARIDFAYDQVNKTFKLLEVNADTPCLFLEAFKATNKAVENYYQEDVDKDKSMLITNSNYGLENEIGAAFSQIFISHIKKGWKSLHNIFVFTACDYCQEDRETAIYLKNIVKRYFSITEEFQCLYVPLKNLVVKDGLLYARCDEQLIKVDMLYRLYPLEFLIEDRDNHGKETGKELLKIYKNKCLILANPPSAFLYQTKYMQSFMFDILLQGKKVLQKSLHHHSALFKYFLPTCNSIDTLAEVVKQSSFVENDDFKIVAKPVLGREGNNIEIFSYMDYCNNKNKILKKFAGGKYIYQLFTETMKKRVNYLADKKYDVIFSCFVLNGKPSAIVCRLSEGITTQVNCQFMPIIEQK